MASLDPEKLAQKLAVDTKDRVETGKIKLKPTNQLLANARGAPNVGRGYDPTDPVSVNLAFANEYAARREELGREELYYSQGRGRMEQFPQQPVAQPTGSTPMFNLANARATELMLVNP